MLNPNAPAPVWGFDELTCPLTVQQVRRLRQHAFAHPWRGDTVLNCPRHFATTTAITDPGRLTRLALSLDYDYHQSGWFANHQFDRCLHLSLSHPRPDRPAQPIRGYVGRTPEVPSDREAAMWGRVVFSRYAPLALYEPAVGPGDPYRTQGVVHLRLWLDQTGRPIKPTGEVYHLRPYPDGSSPLKIVEGRCGADIR